MALTSITTDYTATTSLTFSIPKGVGNNRKLVVFANEQRSPNTITNILLEGVGISPSLSLSDVATNRMFVSEWLDSELPTASGAYKITLENAAGIGKFITAIYCEGAKQNKGTGITSFQTNGDITITAVLSVTKPLNSLGIYFSASSNSISSSQSYIHRDITNASWEHNAFYVTASGTLVVIYSTNTGIMASYIVIEENTGGAATLTITSVGGTNEAYSQQVNVSVLGLALSAGQTFTYKGIACTAVSGTGSTTVKVTMPNFYTNHIKLGRAHEFKVND